ncbi:MAG: cell division protein FtsB [Herminiimonas sp.]|nr:cell division protein FtsB [Herminiimonas sp.]
MRLILICLTALLLLIQFPLWLGKGGWLRVWDLDKQVEAAHRKNDELKARNAKLDSEVQDLRQGTGAVEERARFELGMIKENELFVQVLAPNAKPPPVAASSAPLPASPAKGATPPQPKAPPR